jgi:hypothetical protein
MLELVLELFVGQRAPGEHGAPDRDRQPVAQHETAEEAQPGPDHKAVARHRS